MGRRKRNKRGKGSAIPERAEMTEYDGKCHCGETTWTVKLDEGSHVLWWVEGVFFLLLLFRRGGEYVGKGKGIPLPPRLIGQVNK